MIIGCLNGKGGSGKTTLSLGVAAELAQRGARVLLIDADPQGTASEWHAVRDTPSPFAVVRVDRAVLHREMPKLRRGYDHVVIDGPPRNADLQKSALLACTHVFVPVQPSGADLWASRAFLELLREAEGFAPEGQRVAFVVSRRIPGTVLGREFAATLAEYGLPVLAGTTQRIAYAEALGAGLTVQEYERNGDASRELGALVNELDGLEARQDG